MKFGIIYKITNVINNKTYIGQTKHTLECRIKQHVKSARNNSNYIIHKAIRKYGIDNFDYETIDYTLSQEDANFKETIHIKEHHSLCYDGYGHGYNQNAGGNGQSGFQHGEEFKRKVSGENHWTTRMPHSEAHKQKQKESMLGEKNHFFNKHHTEESKIKSGIQNIGNRYRAIAFFAKSPEGVVFEVNGYREFYRATGLDQRVIKRLLNNITQSKQMLGKQKKYKNWKFSYNKEDIDE